MKRLFACICLSITALGVVLAPSAASAGGWALASFDPLPPLEAGDEAEIGFTILQHGVTPVEDGDWLGDVGVTITDADGTATFFPGAQSGATGHYVVTVTVPAAGAATINAEMGIFESSAPFTVDVDAPSSPGGWPAWTAFVLPVVGVGCLVVVVSDLLAGRRHGRRQEGATSGVVIAGPTT